jgi:hypothetical protein
MPNLQNLNALATKTPEPTEGYWLSIAVCWLRTPQEGEIQTAYLIMRHANERADAKNGDV